MSCRRWSLRAIPIAVLAFLAFVLAAFTAATTTSAQEQTTGGTIEIHVKDCGLAPEGTTVFVDQGDAAPPGFEACVPGNVETRHYGARVNGEPPTYASGDTAIWMSVPNGNYVATADGGAQSSFEIRNWYVGLDLYTKGTVTSEPPVTGLPETGVGQTTSDNPANRDATLPLGILAASLVLGYVSFRSLRMTRS